MPIVFKIQKEHGYYIAKITGNDDAMTMIRKKEKNGETKF